MNILQIVIILIAIESGGDQNAIGDGGKAVGILQIHPIMVAEANRILKRETFTLNDRRDPKKSIAIAMTYLSYQKRRYEAKVGKSPKVARMAASWQSGSIFRPCSNHYTRKIENQMKRNEK